jgi:hypothetical protein
MKNFFSPHIHYRMDIPSSVPETQAHTEIPKEDIHSIDRYLSSMEGQKWTQNQFSELFHNLVTHDPIKFVQHMKHGGNVYPQWVYNTVAQAVWDKTLAPEVFTRLHENKEQVTLVQDNTRNKLSELLAQVA